MSYRYWREETLFCGRMNYGSVLPIGYALGNVVIACDSMDFDFAFLRPTLNPWPTNVSGHPLLLNMNHLLDIDRFDDAVEKAFSKGLRRHHALDDAKANQLGWLVAGRDTDRPAPKGR